MNSPEQNFFPILFLSSPVTITMQSDRPITHWLTLQSTSFYIFSPPQLPPLLLPPSSLLSSLPKPAIQVNVLLVVHILVYYSSSLVCHRQHHQHNHNNHNNNKTPISNSLPPSHSLLLLLHHHLDLSFPPVRKEFISQVIFCWFGNPLSEIESEPSSSVLQKPLSSPWGRDRKAKINVTDNHLRWGSGLPTLHYI